MDKYLPIKNFSEEAYQFVLNALENGVDCGHYEFSDGAYANIGYSETKPIPQMCYEAHRQWLDVHLILEGTECVGIEDLETMRSGEMVFDYDEAKDAELWSHNDKGTLHILKPGDYVLALPEHAHMPGATPEGADTRVKKLLIKAPVSLWKK
jgi:YhcH/YjgK/YiaL family protein